MSSNASESSGTQDALVGPVSQVSRRRSTVWEHFEPNLVNVDGDLKAVCKYCQLQLNTKSGTSSLRGHIASACPAVAADVRKRFQATMNKQASEGLFVFDPKICRERMTDFIIHAEIAFLKFEDPYLQPWIDTMQPTFKVKGRQTIRDDCLKKYEAMKKELQDELRCLDSRVCLTSDIWTSSQDIGYMVITAHYIDPEFNVKKRILSFKKLNYPHDGFAIEDAIVKCVTAWEIRDKLFTLTLDNASNNTSACAFLIANHKRVLLFEGEHLHVRCCAHILNILVQDGMKIIHLAINKLRELLKHIDSSPSRIQEFNSLANGMGLRSKAGIYIDIPNRWNSTYKMLREAQAYKATLTAYANRHYEISLSADEWSKAEALCEFLKAFEELTLAVSAHRKPTAHKFLPVVLCIRHALKDPEWQTTNLLKDLAASMRVKFDKYWDPDEDDPNNDDNHRRRNKDIPFNHALVIATLLDPTRKGEYLDFFYQKVCRSADQIDIRVADAMDWMRKYFREYEQRVRTSSSDMRTRSEVNSVSVGSPVLGKRKLEEEFAQYKSQRRTARSQKSELDSYLEEEPEEGSASFDVLAWWKSKSEKFPVLSTMARDFLAIPLSTVSSESAFSCAGRILGDTRTSLTPEMLEALVCTKDWLFKTNDVHLEDEAQSSCSRVGYSSPGPEESHPGSFQYSLAGSLQLL